MLFIGTSNCLMCTSQCSSICVRPQAAWVPTKMLDVHQNWVCPQKPRLPAGSCVDLRGPAFFSLISSAAASYCKSYSQSLSSAQPCKGAKRITIQVYNEEYWSHLHGHSVYPCKWDQYSSLYTWIKFSIIQAEPLPGLVIFRILAYYYSNIVQGYQPA